MTVATSVSSASAPRSRMASARMRHDLVAVDDRARRVDREAPVGVAVVARCRRRRRARRRPRCSCSGWVEPQPSLMLQPSGSAPMTTTSAPAARSAAGATSLAAPLAQSTTTCRPSSRCGSAASSARRSARRRRRAAGSRPTSPPVGRCQSSPQPRLDGVLELVGELEAAAGEELDAVVGHRVVRRREHDAEVGADVGGEEGDGRRRQHAGVEDVDARDGQPGDTAAARNSPEPGGRGRRPRRGGARRTAPTSPSTCAAATERSSASSAVTSRLASPRTPSVPNSRPRGVLRSRGAAVATRAAPR